MRRMVVVGGALLVCVPLLAVQGAAGALVCPPGAASPSYCSNVNAPTVTTEAARELTPTSAVLAGTINTYGVATTYRFEYGTTSAYGSSTPEGALVAMPGQPASATSVSVTAAIANLKPSTTYHFRLVATSVGGTTAGADMTFTTVDEAGALLETKTLRATGDRLVSLPMRCAKQPRCVGKVELLPVGHKASAAAKHRGKGSAIDGEAQYSLAYGQSATLRIKLDKRAREILSRIGRLTVAVVAVFSDPQTTVIGDVTIVGARKHTSRHVTHAKTSPGFTG